VVERGKIGASGIKNAGKGAGIFRGVCGRSQGFTLS
jgi:hypothetical protein